MRGCAEELLFGLRISPCNAKEKEAYAYRNLYPLLCTVYVVSSHYLFFPPRHFLAIITHNAIFIS